MDLLATQSGVDDTSSARSGGNCRLDQVRLDLPSALRDEDALLSRVNRSCRRSSCVAQGGWLLARASPRRCAGCCLRARVVGSLNGGVWCRSASFRHAHRCLAIVIGENGGGGLSDLFKSVPWTVQELVGSVVSGALRLPDLQRPFVWEKVKVRDFVDSLYRGYPVGELMFWKVPGDEDAKPIGVNTKTQSAVSKIVDGQQRLTSLYAIMTGEPVVDDEYRREPIRALADRCWWWLPSVAVVDEFDDDDERDGEGELGESVLGFAVGVASDLAVVGEPRVGALDDPAQSQRRGGGLGRAVAGGGLALGGPADVADASGGCGSVGRHSRDRGAACRCRGAGRVRRSGPRWGRTG